MRLTNSTEAVSYFKVGLSITKFLMELRLLPEHEFVKYFEKEVFIYAFLAKINSRQTKISRESLLRYASP